MARCDTVAANDIIAIGRTHGFEARGHTAGAMPDMSASARFSRNGVIKQKALISVLISPPELPLHFGINILQRELAPDRDEFDQIFKVHSVGIQPLALGLFGVMLNVWPIVRDEEIFEEGIELAIVLEFFDAIVVFRGGRKHFYDPVGLSNTSRCSSSKRGLPQTTMTSG